MRVMPLAADSLGVRSMATYVEAGDLRLLIDPGATLSPNRFGLPPTSEEEEALGRALDRIGGYARRGTMITVGHYPGDKDPPAGEVDAGPRGRAKGPPAELGGGPGAGWGRRIRGGCWTSPRRPGARRSGGTWPPTAPSRPRAGSPRWAACRCGCPPRWPTGGRARGSASWSPSPWTTACGSSMPPTGA